MTFYKTELLESLIKRGWNVESEVSDINFTMLKKGIRVRLYLAYDMIASVIIENEYKNDKISLIGVPDEEYLAFKINNWRNNIALIEFEEFYDNN